ncbi:MAG: helicase-exonuclease AddAB subunit AddA [Porcipelethomonas sp.]
MNKWTDEQKSAIDAKGCSVIVSAAAGSGKTSVLVERLLRIIADNVNKVPVEKMIVATFTNDAAAEMKQRLSAALSGLIEKHPDNSWLSRQYSMIGSASISTIHSFCFELIRNNVTQLSLSAGFRIADETEEAMFRNEVLLSLMEKYYTEKSELMKILTENFCRGSSDKVLENILLSIYKNVSSIPFFRKWMKKAIDKYNSGIYRDYYVDFLNGKFRQAKELLESIGEKTEAIGNIKLSAMYMNDKAMAENIIQKVFSPDPDDILPEIKFSRFPVFSKEEKNTIDPDIRGEIKTLRDSMIEIFKSTAPGAREVLLYEDADLERHKQIAGAVCTFISEFDAELRKYKDQKNAVGFDDAEQLVLNLLAECDNDGNITKTSLAQELSQYYEIIMIDEFQDSNNRQDMIFRLLSRNGSAEEYGSNLFFVGDVKQSIYRFRLANPDNFLNAVESSVPYKCGNEISSHIKLNKNFRSSDEVIDFVNYMFSHIMMKETGEIDYNTDEYLVRGANFYPSERTADVIMFNRSELPDNAEAACIAEKIAGMIRDKHLVSTDGGKSFRPCEMRDFCILKRTNTSNDIYIKELEKRGLFADCEEAKGYLRSREISILINLLKSVDNPLNDIALTSVMMSPMFVMTADDIAEIRLIDIKGSMYNNMVKGIGLNGNEPVFSDDLRIRAEFVYNTIAELRLYSSVYTIQELIQKIYDNTDFLSVMQLYKDSEKKKANLRLLLEYAGNYEKNSNGGLSGFIKYIDRVSERNDDFKSASASASSRNAVSVKTMHKSKGLEFPFVFIAETLRKFNRIDETAPYQFSYNMGLGFIGQNREKYERFTTLPFEAIKIYNHKCAVAEEMRLLYVALTRAKEKLFITVDISESRAKKALVYAENMKAANGITPVMISEASSMADWIMMTLLSMKKNGPLREKLGIYECFAYDDCQQLNFDYYDKEEDESEFREITVSEEVNASEENVKALERIIGTEYDTRLSSLTAKLSVSDISKENKDFAVPLKRPGFSSANRELTAAEKGTALHKFLQFADFEVLENSMESELQRLFNSGYLTAAQRDSIKKADVEAFLTSGLFKRIKKSQNIIREQKFLVSIDDLELDDDFGNEYKNTEGMLNGIIDMILVENNSIILVDYKTDRISNVNELAEKYRSQLLLYKKTLDKIQPLPVSEALIYSFYKKTEIRVF